MVTLLCSSKLLVRARWREVLERDGLTLVEADPKQEDTLRSLEHLDVEVVLLHLPHSVEERIDRINRLRGRHKQAKLIVFSDMPTEEEGMALLKIGAVGYCNTYIAPALLSKAVQAVRGGEVWAGRRLMHRLILGLAKASAINSGVQTSGSLLDSLTQREREIALLIGSGASNKRIAQRLDITERTVKSHLSTIFRKTGTRDRLQLALVVNREVGANGGITDSTSN